MDVKMLVEAIDRAVPDYGSPMEIAKLHLSEIDSICRAKQWTRKRYFEVNPHEAWHLAQTVGLIKDSYESLTGHRRPEE